MNQQTRDLPQATAWLTCSSTTLPPWSGRTSPPSLQATRLHRGPAMASRLREASCTCMEASMALVSIKSAPFPTIVKIGSATHKSEHKREHDALLYYKSMKLAYHNLISFYTSSTLHPLRPVPPTYAHAASCWNRQQPGRPVPL